MKLMSLAGFRFFIPLCYILNDRLKRKDYLFLLLSETPLHLKKHSTFKILCGLAINHYKTITLFFKKEKRTYWVRFHLYGIKEYYFFSLDLCKTSSTIP